MSQNLLTPDWEPGLSIQDLPIEHFHKEGIKALVLDVDGTLLPRGEIVLHDSVFDWVKQAQKHFKLHLLSNNPSKKRIEAISQQVNINFTYKAAKPTRTALRKILQKLQIAPCQIAIVGDRLFTDVLVGNRLGLYSVLVRPLGLNGEQSLKNRTQRLEQTIASLLEAIKT